jgi:transposase
MTTLLPSNIKVHLALGFIDMRKGIDCLAMLVQGVLRQDPFTGHLFVFRGRTRSNLIKIIYWDGTGFCLFTKRLEQGVFLWPPSVKPDETLSLTSAQLSSLIEGVDWRAPEQRWRPATAGCCPGIGAHWLPSIDTTCEKWTFTKRPFSAHFSCGS